MNKLSDETIGYIEALKRDYEKRYKIQVCYWFVRKSTLRGLGRSTSDLDVAFLFRSLDQGTKRIIFERADRRNEIQCYSIADAAEIASVNKKAAMENREFALYYKDKMLKHYILDYYNGFYCSLGSDLKRNDYGFWEACGKSFELLYEPLVAARLCLDDMEGLMGTLQFGYRPSLNQYLNAIWSGLACVHMLDGGLPGCVDIIEMAQKYLTEPEVQLIKKLVRYFRKTIQKQSNYSNTPEINEILYRLGRKCRHAVSKYQVQKVDVPQAVARIETYLERGE